MAEEGSAATVILITRAIQDRVCLRGTHYQFRVRFAPHALGRDYKGRRNVIAFEYGGLTLGRPNWVCLVVARLRGLQQTGDPWCSGSLETRPQWHLAEIEAAVDESWAREPLTSRLRRSAGVKR